MFDSSIERQYQISKFEIVMYSQNDWNVYAHTCTEFMNRKPE